MKDPLISRFAEACGATGPLDMRVELAQGGVLAEGSVSMPFALVGRDDACDVTLNDAAVNPRHAWLQVVDGRVFAVDLGSRNGLKWPRGISGSAWLDVGIPVRVGPFQLRLKSPVSTRSHPFPPTYHPLQSDSSVSHSRPTVNLEFRNGNRAKDRWTVNRLLTLIGRSPDCKIRLSADGIASYHCGLVLAPDGLWVVDLSGRGVVVNGERMRVAPLLQDAELWIGRFLVGINYAASAITPPNGRPGVLTSPNPIPALSCSAEAIPDALPVTSRTANEDEVELGAAPTIDPVSGLPSSHIMADAFRLWGNGCSNAGPVSNPILLSGSGPASFATPAQVPPPAHFMPTSASSALNGLLGGASDPAEAVVELLRQLGEMHGHMLGQFQQTLMLMVQLFGCLQREQLPAMQRQLERIQELNAQLTHLQGEVARRAAEMIAARSTPQSSSVTPERAPDLPGPSDSTDLHHWVVDRINSLQQERETRWQSIVGMFSEKSAG